MNAITLERWSLRLSRKAVGLLTLHIKKRLGHGGIKKVEIALGRGERHWENVKKLKRGIRFADLLIVLRVIGMPLQEFSTELLAGESPLEQSSGAHLRLNVFVLQALASLEDQPQDSVTHRVRPDVELELKALDARRHDDPMATLGDVHAKLTALSRPSEIATALSVAGSALRHLDQTEDALSCLTIANWLAGEKNALRASILLRLSSLQNLSSQLSALASIREAREIYAQLCNLRGLGQTFISQALYHAAIGDLYRSDECFMAALGYQGYLRQQDLIGIYQGLAQNAHRTHRSAGALSWIEKALHTVQEMSNQTFKGYLLRAKGCLAEDETLLFSAIEAFGSNLYFDSTLCSLDLAKLLSSYDRQQELRRFLRSRIEWAHENQLAFAARLFEDLLSSVCLEKQLNFQELGNKVKNWRAKTYANQLARLQPSSK